MKNQYFGDNKDLFTYDLVMNIMQAGLVRHFSFIPMLTGNEANGHGAKYDRAKARAGTGTRVLVDFLDGCLAAGRRDIGELEGFFAGQGIKMTIYRGGDDYFTHRQRRDYFAGIGDGLLKDTLIFLDPDIGLEVAHPGEKHLLYSEVGDIYKRMDAGSILMIFQHFPRAPRQEYLNWRCTELKEKVTDDWPVCIDDDEIIFFFLTKDESLEHSLVHIIQDYAERNGG